ncbi:hypothetical protein PINS_up016820 [Pythium insidiosum]|nr:hypothetical protein PINS_up016820 [Pythium insidiosum]
MIYDDKRHQCALSASVAAALAAELEPIWRQLLPDHRAESWFCLRSLPGGDCQVPHTDFPPSHAVPVLDYRKVPFGLLLALESETVLLEYGWNRLVADERDENAITLNAGDLLLFRGDLIHAGAAYSSVNYRVHASLYPSTTTTPHPMKNTFIVPVLGEQLPSLAATAASRMCIFDGCDYAPRGKNLEENLKRHIHRSHHIRINKKPRKNDDE